MKKVLFFLLTLLVASSVMAQTLEESQKLTNSQASKLEARLSEINDAIYYLSVTLTERIKANPVNSQYLSKLKKEKYFAKEDSIRLTEEKKIIEKDLLGLKLSNSSALGQRTEFGEKSNSLQEMSTKEFNRRSRAQIYRAREDFYNRTSISKKFEGVLINYKTGKNDFVIFSIYRADAKSESMGSFMLNPKTSLKVELLPGKYDVDISDGVRTVTVKVEVDPSVRKYADGAYVYWFAYGNY